MLKEEIKIHLDVDTVYQDFLVYKYNLNKLDYDMKKRDIYKKYKIAKKLVKAGLVASVMLTVVPGILQYNHILSLTSFYPNLIMATFVGCLTAFFSFNAIDNLCEHKQSKLDKEMSDKVVEKDVMDYIAKKYGKDFIEFLLIKYKMEVPYAIIPDIEKEKNDMVEIENIKNKARIITSESYR